MAHTQKQFEEFHENIRISRSMNETLRDKRDKVLDRIKNHLKSNNLPTFRRLLQGSYQMKTGTIPLDGQEYDIDVGLRFPVEHDGNELKASEVRGWVHAAVDGHTTKVEKKRSCIRVTYSKGFHIDLVCYSVGKAHRKPTQYQLADKDTGWRPTEPADLLEYIRQALKEFKHTENNQTQTDQLRRIVRYLRRWNDFQHVTHGIKRATGLAFVLLACAKLKPVTDSDGTPNDLRALRNMVSQDANRMERISVKKPTQEYEDLFTGFSDEEMKAFKDAWNDLADALSKAEIATDLAIASGHLRKVFGDDFPVVEKEKPMESRGPAIISSSTSA
ncbi:MAG: hypothetical protein CMF59_13520 [Leptospiraceae bacterium]|nr:hypothetical protein [Leptospiraceae bacterium]